MGSQTINNFSNSHKGNNNCDGESYLLSRDFNDLFLHFLHSFSSDHTVKNFQAP